MYSPGDYDDRPDDTAYVRRLARSGCLGSCDCPPRCDNCGDYEQFHTDGICDADPEGHWTPTVFPETYYIETYAGTKYQPAEGVAICETCKRERE